MEDEHIIGSCPALSHIRGRFNDRFMELDVNIENINEHCIKSMLSPACIKLTCDLLTELFEERNFLMYDIIENVPDDEAGISHAGKTV